MRQLKHLSLLLGLLLLGPSAYAQSVRFQSQAISSRGAGIANATVAVCTQPANTNTQPCSPLATLATSTSTTSGGANPLTADSFGNFFFYAAPGRYTVQIYGPAVSGQLVVPDVDLGGGGGAGAFGGITYTGNGVRVTGPACTVAGLQTALTAIQGTPIVISTASETGTTVTLTFATSPNLASGTLINVQNVSQPGYNGEFTTTGGTANTVTYVVNSSGIASGTGGQVTTGFGTVDATACTGNISTQITNANAPVVIPAGVTLLLGPSVWTCTVTTANLPCWQLQGDASKFFGAGTGYGASDSVDPPTNMALGITNLMGSALGTTTDMIHATVNNPSTFFGGLVKGVKISGLWINMGASGEDAVRVTAFNDLEISDIAAYNFNGNGVHIEGSVANGSAAIAGGGTCSGTPCGQAYHFTITRSRFAPPHTNTTGAACFLDGVNGEVAYFALVSVRCSGNNTNGGGAQGLLAATHNAGAPGFGVDTGIIQGYFGNTANAAINGGMGIQLRGDGSWPTSSAGTENSISIQGSIIEHQFNPASGIGIGCTNASNTRSGAACGDIGMTATNAGGWSTANIDYANLGEGFGSVGSSQQDFGNPPLRASGNNTGPNANGLRVETILNAGAASQVESGINNVPSVNDKGFATQTMQGIISAPTLAVGGTAANFSTWEAARFDGSGIANGIGLHVANSDEIFDNTTRWTEGTVNTGGVSVVDLCKGLTAYHQFSCNNNASAAGAGANNGFWPVGITGNTAGTHSDSGFYQTASAAGCTTAASIGGVCATPVTITWPVAFQDANYKVACQGSGAITNFPIMGSVTARVAANATVQTMALTAAAASFTTIECIAVHN